jgi:hypothetical protein
VAFWDTDAKTVTCLECLASTDASTANGEAVGDELVFDRGVPGASARRRYERLHTQREQRVREKIGRFGGIYLALTSDPQSTVAWAQGSRGERLLGEFLGKRQDESVFVVLHDRRIPGTRANIDHIAITRSGTIWAIDAKNYSGKVQRIDRGGWFSTDLRLYVGRRDCTKLVHGMAKQVDALRMAFDNATVGEFRVEVRPGLCFVGAEWSFFAKPFELGGVWIGWPKALEKSLRADGQLASRDLAALARSVAAALPKA